MTTMDLAIIGGASLDTLHFQGHTESSAGGAGLYTALAAHRAGARTTMFAPVPSPMPPELAPAATRLHWIGPVVPPEELPAFEIAHRESGKSEMVAAHWGAEAELAPAALPAEGLCAGIVYCGPLADPANQLAFVQHFHRLGRRTACGTYGRAVRHHTQIVRETLALADIFFCNEDEARVLFGEIAAARTQPGKLLFITLGEHGAVVVQGEHHTHVPGQPVVELDPTGAGDTFCGTTLALLSQGEHPVLAAQQAVACAAEMVTAVGPTMLWRDPPLPAPQPDARVRVDHAQVERVSGLVAQLSEVRAFDFGGEDFPPVDHPRALDFFFSATLQQFGFWSDDGRRYQQPFIAPFRGGLRKGSDYLWAAYRRWLDDDPLGLTPGRQAQLTDEGLAQRLRTDTDDSPMPAFELHLEQAGSYGRDMLALGWSPAAIVARANASDRPLQTFLTQLDHVGGYKEDPLRKKSVLLALILQQRPERFLRAAPSEQLPPIIDYHLQRSCLRIGLVEVLDEGLRLALVERRLLRASDEWVIRRAAYEAVHQVQRASGKSMGAIDWFFFGARRRCPEMTEPECGLCPVEPACAQAKELFQPVIRTTFY